MTSGCLPHPPGGTDAARAKAGLRADLLERRRQRTVPERQGAADALARHALAWPAVAGAGSVAAYVSVGSEPGTGPLLDTLHARGVRVLLPVLLDDNDLAWAPYEGPSTLARAGRGLREPTAAPLGVEAIADADVVLVPGLAVDRTGARLGRGGGSYDRALARVADTTPVAVLVHGDEVLATVPAEPHDRRVSHALTPEALISLRGGKRLRDPAARITTAPAARPRSPAPQPGRQPCPPSPAGDGVS